MWYKSILNPIPKKGKDHKIPLNNRTISLISTVAKVFSCILNNRLLKYLEDNNLLVDEQNGFRKLRSCLDHLYVITTTIQNRRKQKLPTYACFVDFSKAFDTISHEIHLRKFIDLRFPPGFILWLESYGSLFIKLNPMQQHYLKIQPEFRWSLHGGVDFR